MNDESKEPRDGGKLTAGELTDNSPALRWLDNFWYHHKWTVIISLFFAVILIIGVLQICNRESYDIQVAVAVPYTMNAEERDDFLSLLSRFSKDYNGDGDTMVYLHTDQIYSDEEYQSERAYWEAQSQEFYIDSSYNKAQLDDLEQYLMNGECSVLFLSPYMYEVKRDNGHLMPLSELYGDELPAGATADGYGIRLSETDFYTGSPAARVLPENTILCLHVKLINGRDEDYAHAKELFRSIADHRVKE